MKKSGIITTATVAGLVLAGGGIALGAALSNTDEPSNAIIETVEPTETYYTGSYEPEASATPDETATVEPTESAIPTATAYTEAEQIYLPWARENYDFYASTTPRLQPMSDADLIDALHLACAAIADDPYSPTESLFIPGFDSVEELDADTWEDDANALFLGAARNGYGPGITGTAGSYCD